MTDVFQGQPKSDGLSNFLVDQGRQRQAFDVEGFGNAPLVLSRDSLCENVRSVQMAQGLKPVEHLEGDGLTLTIEMETGTGKTYTYIKTMYELNVRYGWSKFIIVVPSIAIREGVYKSFVSMAEHFAGEYGRRMQYFIYNSKQLSKIDGFAQDNGIHVMIINTQAFNASLNEEKNKEGRGGDAAARIIFSRRDEFGSRRPIDILAKTNPIMIIDEPQSVLGTDKSNATRKRIRLFNPLFTLLYSATHRKGDIYNMVFRLDAIDAYNRKLVKKVEVKGVRQIGSTATNGYVYLDEIVITQDENVNNVQLNAGDVIEVKCEVKLPNFNPENVSVQVYYGQILDNGIVNNVYITEMKLQESNEEEKRYKYVAKIKLMNGGNFGYTFRVMPKHEMLLDSENLNLIKWMTK